MFQLFSDHKSLFGFLVGHTVALAYNIASLSFYIATIGTPNLSNQHFSLHMLRISDSYSAKNHNAPRKEVHSTDTIEVPYCPGYPK